MKHVLPFSPLAALASPLPNSSQFALGLHLPAGFPVPALCKAQHLDPPPPRLASICLVLGQLTSWTSKLSRRRTSLVNEIVFFFFLTPSQDGIVSRARGGSVGLVRFGQDPDDRQRRARRLVSARVSFPAPPNRTAPSDGRPKVSASAALAGGPRRSVPYRGACHGRVPPFPVILNRARSALFLTMASLTPPPSAVPGEDL